MSRLRTIFLVRTVRRRREKKTHTQKRKEGEEEQGGMKKKEKEEKRDLYVSASIGEDGIYISLRIFSILGGPLKGRKSKNTGN